MVTSRDVQILWTSRSHLKISGARSVTGSKFRTENPQMLDVMATWLPGFVHPWIRVQIIDLSLCTVLDHPVSSSLLVQIFPLAPLCANTLSPIFVLCCISHSMFDCFWAWNPISQKNTTMSLYYLLRFQLFHPPVFFTLYKATSFIKQVKW